MGLSTQEATSAPGKATYCAETPKPIPHSRRSAVCFRCVTIFFPTSGYVLIVAPSIAPHCQLLVAEQLRPERSRAHATLYIIMPSHRPSPFPTLTDRWEGWVGLHHPAWRRAEGQQARVLPGQKQRLLGRDTELELGPSAETARAKVVFVARA